MSESDDTFVLSPEQRKGLDQANEWERDALVELGSAYLRHEEAKRELGRAAALLQECERHAREARSQNQTILAAIASSLNLPNGRWVYDPAAGALRKEGG